MSLVHLGMIMASGKRMHVCKSWTIKCIHFFTYCQIPLHIILWFMIFSFFHPLQKFFFHICWNLHTFSWDNFILFKILLSDIQISTCIYMKYLKQSYNHNMSFNRIGTIISIHLFLESSSVNIYLQTHFWHYSLNR